MPLPQTQKVLLRIPNGAGRLEDVAVDACITEQHSLTNSLTDHPVEQGANITDHSRPDPRKLTLECIHTNTPLTEEVIGLDRASALWLQFVDLHDNPRLIEVQTVRDYYPSMGVESVSSPVDVKSAQALKFTISLKQVRVVANKFTRVVVAKDTRAQPKQKKGAVTTEPEVKSTALAKVSDAIGFTSP